MAFGTDDMVLAAAIGAVVGGILVGTFTSGPDGQTLALAQKYQTKYGEEVCKQRNADLHRLGNLGYLVCMDKTTKVLSDFD